MAGAPEGLRDKILSWIAEDEFNASIESPPPGAPLDWVIRATSHVPVQANVIVQKPKGKDNIVIVSLGVVVSDHHYRRLLEMKEKERARAVFELIRSLNLMCPDCIVIIQPSIVDVQRILVTRALYTESLTREKLLSTIRIMVNMFALISLDLTTRFGPLPGRKPSDSSSLEYL